MRLSTAGLFSRANSSRISAQKMQKLYAPPLPKHMMPTNNPFYSRKFVSKSKSERDREQKESFKEWVSSSGNRAIKRKVRKAES